MIRTRCKCGAKLRAPNAGAGRPARCPRCRKIVRFPRTAQFAEPDPPRRDQLIELHLPPPCRARRLGRWAARRWYVAAANVLVLFGAALGGWHWGNPERPAAPGVAVLPASAAPHQVEMAGVTERGKQRLAPGPPREVESTSAAPRNVESTGPTSREDGKSAAPEDLKTPQFGQPNSMLPLCRLLERLGWACLNDEQTAAGRVATYRSESDRPEGKLCALLVVLGVNGRAVRVEVSVFAGPQTPQEPVVGAAREVALLLAPMESGVAEACTTAFERMIERQWGGQLAREGLSLTTGGNRVRALECVDLAPGDMPLRVRLTLERMD